MKTRKEMTITVLGGHRNMVIPEGTRCDPAHNQPKNDSDPWYWAKASRKMDKNTKNGIRAHGILLKKSEILRGIE